MVKCVECEHFYAEMVYCREYSQKIRKYNIDLQCVHFSPRATPIDQNLLEKLEQKDKVPKLPEAHEVGFFGPRWISKYAVQSIRQCGDMSLAYEMLFEDSENQKAKIHNEPYTSK